MTIEEFDRRGTGPDGRGGRQPADISALVGPTGTGKTELALALAGPLEAEIVNADSRQVYRGLDIGSAKPSTRQRSEVAHHLFDVVDPNEPFDCARYRELALDAIAAIRQRGHRVLLVGGTGLYLKVLRYGLCPAPPRDQERRIALEAVEDRQPGALHARLRRVDPQSASRIHPRDRLRLVRALEVYELTGKPLSDWQAAHGFRRAELAIRVVGLDMERQQLYQRLAARCRAMVDGGLIGEVEALWRRGFGPELPPMRSIGYREAGAYLRGHCDLPRSLADMTRATRHLAKRQLTWFRADRTIAWLDATRPDVEEALATLCR